MLKKLTRKPIIPIMKLVVSFCHDGYGERFCQTVESFFKLPCIVVRVVCSICSGLKLSQGKQGKNYRNLREYDFLDLADILFIDFVLYISSFALVIICTTVLISLSFLE